MNSDESNTRPLPDLYHLLGLEPLESDASVIKVALQRWQGKADRVRATEPDQARRAQRLVGLGRRNLLDPLRKSAYDAKWRKAFGGELVAATVNSRPQRFASPSLAELLPSQDPTPAFDLSQYLQSSGGQGELDWQAHWDIEFQHLCDRLTKSAAPDEAGLERLGSPSKSDDGAGDLMGTVLAGSISSDPAAVLPKTALVDAEAMAPFAKPSWDIRPRSDSVNASTSALRLVQRNRKKRDRGVLYMATGALAGTAGLLYVMFLLLNPRVPAEVVGSKAGGQNFATQNGTTATLQAKPKPPRSSGLPQVTGLDPDADLSPDSSLFQLDAESGGMLQNSFADNKAMGGNEELAAAQELPSMNANELETSGMELTTMPDAAMAGVELTEAQQQSWNEGVAAIRSQLLRLNFDAVAEPIATMKTIAQSAEFRAELAQWESIIALTKSAHHDLVEAIEGLGAAEVVSIGGTTQVSFIEGDAERLVVKFRGETQRYPIAEIPLGIANGIMDLKMPASDPRTPARKAAYALLRKNLNQRTRNKSLETLRQAEAGDLVPLGVADRLANF